MTMPLPASPRERSFPRADRGPASSPAEAFQDLADDVCFPRPAAELTDEQLAVRVGHAQRALEYSLGLRGVGVHVIVTHGDVYRRPILSTREPLRVLQATLSLAAACGDAAALLHTAAGLEPGMAVAALDSARQHRHPRPMEQPLFPERHPAAARAIVGAVADGGVDRLAAAMSPEGGR